MDLSDIKALLLKTHVFVIWCANFLAECRGDAPHSAKGITEPPPRCSDQLVALETREIVNGMSRGQGAKWWQVTSGSGT